MSLLPPPPILYHISAGTSGAGDCPEPCFRELTAAGVPLLQIREPGLAAADLRVLAARLRRQCRPGHALILINDRVDVARAAGLDGVHLRADGRPVHRVREQLGPDFIIGCSAHDEAEVRRAEDGGADFVVVGPVFPTPSKPGHPGLGLVRLRQIRLFSVIPVLALGGIGAANAGAVLECGVHGLAGIRLFHDRRQLATVQALTAARRGLPGAGAQTGQDSCP